LNDDSLYFESYLIEMNKRNIIRTTTQKRIKPSMDSPLIDGLCGLIFEGGGEGEIEGGRKEG